MKTTKRTFGKLLALVLVCLFALTAAIPVFAAPAAGPGNLKVTIRNNEGLPAMKTTQFSVYQIFKGTAYKDPDVTVNTDENHDWDAFSWNNYTLADIEWGDSLKGDGVVAALKTALSTAEWAKDKDGINVFAAWAAEAAPMGTAAELAEILAEHTDNAFLQKFANTVMGVSGLTPLNLGVNNPVLENGENDTATDDSLTFTLPAAGYYLFAENPAEHTDTEDAVSEYILAVLGEQSILLKASVPGVEKDIIDGTNLEKGDVDGVGDYVQFKLTGTLPKNYGDFDTYAYIFHDTLSKGLAYVEGDSDHPLTVRVYENQGAANADPTATQGGTVIPATYGTEPTGGNNYAATHTNGFLDVSFTDLKALKKDGEPEAEPISVTADSVIVVTYWAKVTEDAVIGVEGNPNTVDLEYSNDPNSDGTGRTKEKKVTVYAFGLDLIKIGSDKPEGLADAGFVLKNEDGYYAQFKEQYVIKTTADGKTTTTFSDEKPESTEGVTGPVRRLTGWVDVATVTAAIKDYNDATDASAKATAKANLDKYLLESGTDGKIPDVYGLGEGSYTLEEVITPDGYNTMDDFEFSIVADIDTNGDLKSVTYTHGEKVITYKATYGVGDEAEDNLIAHFNAGLVQDTLTNQKAPFLPFTGGIGTLIFYVLGTALIVGAITYLVVIAKKRKKAE